MNSQSPLPRILAVDDRSENLMSYEALLSEVHCEVICRNSGPAALDYLKDNEVALILLDVQMPVMDGFETAHRIRELSQHAMTPILFVTAINHDRQHVLKAARLKVADVIYKPIDVEVFLVKIQIFLDLFEARKFKKIQYQTFFLDAPGELPPLYREKDWSQTSLGGVESWPLSLKTMVGVMLTSKFPKYIIWGPERIFLYNDAYVPLLADKHPRGLGQTFEEVWPEVWEQLKPMILSVEEGKSFYFQDKPLNLFRNGKMEEGVFTFSFSPIRNDTEKVGGVLCTCIETTEQKRVQQQIARSERTLDQIFNESPSFMAFLRAPDFVFERANNEYLALVEKKEIIGKSVFEVLPEVEAQGFIELLEKVTKEKAPYIGNEVPVEFRLDDGTLKKSFLDFVYQPLINQNGDVYGIIAQGYDVTEKVLARKQVEESEAFLKLITDSIPDFISYIDSNEHYQFVNPTYETWLHKKAEDIIGKSLKDVVGKSYPKSKEKIDRALKGETLSFETHLKNEAGVVRKLNVSYIPDIDRDQKVMGVVVVGHDVTAIQEATDRLAKIQSISSNLAKSLTIKDIARVVVEEGVPAIGASKGVICLKDPDGIHLNAIHAMGYPQKLINHYSRITVSDNYPLSEAVRTGQPVIIHPSEDIQERFPGLELSQELTEKRTVIAFPIKIRGQTLGALGLAYPLHQVVDQSSLNVIQTLTELAGQAIDRADVYEKEKAARLSAEIAKDEAERANVLKSAFLANMSHEIRTPLGAMIGFADLLRDPRLSSQEHSNYIDILVKNGEQLSIIINDILDLSKVEAGHLTLEYVESCPDQIAVEVISLLKMKAKEKNLDLTYTTDSSTPKSIVSDPTRIRQILMNLVGNAIKFTQKGGIFVKSYGHYSQLGASSITFEITDTGIGLSPEQQENIFKMFVQADGSMTRRFGGTGLGLTLSRSLARALGGDVQVKESTLGKGTTFTVTIENHPERKEQTRVQSPQTPSTRSIEPIRVDALKDVKVLVIDDAPDNQFLIRSFLSKRGAWVDSAENGLEGYQKALAGSYDVVLMDIQMPVMDGYTATQKLRDQGYKKPIIALTAHAMNEVAKKCLNVGCTDHLSKPIDSQQLIQTIVRYSPEQ